MWRSIAILAFLMGSMSYSAPARAADSHYVLLKAKIVAILGYHFDEAALNDILMSHSVETLFSLDVEQVLWGKFAPDKTNVSLVIASNPITPHIGRSIYVMARNDHDGDYLVSRYKWSFTDKAMCLLRSDRKYYGMSKKDLRRLNAAGVVVVADANDMCP